jgi:flagellin
MAVINTNVASLNAQRNLMSSQSALNTSIQRLSSGLRINSAKDDAAGLAIATRMGSQISGLNQAVRNANDGISLVQTAEGALSTITDNLQRIRELAVQSANATNSTGDRAAIDTEVQQLKSEIQRVATTTSFNGTKLLDGSFTNATFQVGANNGETISVPSIANAQTNALGVSTRASLNSVSIASLSTAAINSGDITVNAQNIGALGAAANVSDRANQLVTAINAISTTTGVTAVIDTTSNTIQLNSAANITVTNNLPNQFNAGPIATASATATAGISSVDVLSAAHASQALDTIDSALATVNTARANLGAIQNRFSSTVATLQTTTENLAAAKSRIMDTDFAAETANMTRGQILQQAGTAMLAQANSLPNTVLKLLQ